MVQGDMGLDLDEKPFKNQTPEQTNKQMLPPPTTMRNRLGMPGQMFPPAISKPDCKKIVKTKTAELAHQNCNQEIQPSLVRSRNGNGNEFRMERSRLVRGRRWSPNKWPQFLQKSQK